MEFSALLSTLLKASHAAPAAPESLSSWFDHFGHYCLPGQSSAANALLAGACADRLGYAFAGGYAAALQGLLHARELRPAALCVTESEGNSPRHIQTTLSAAAGQDQDGYVLNGEKAFVTMADHAEWLWIAASRGENDGRKDIVMVGVPRHSPGVTLVPLPALPFAPEIGHAKVKLENVYVDASEVLPQDGYADYVKPFRTIEDLHVSAAASGMLLAHALRRQWPQETIEAWLSLAHQWYALAHLPPASHATHLVLAGTMRRMQQLMESVTPLIEQDAEFASRWTRDRPLLNVATKARIQRTQNAWQQWLAST